MVEWATHCKNIYKLASLGQPGGMSTMPMLSNCDTGWANSRCWFSTRSMTQEADSLASASWSQHSSIVSQRAESPCNLKKGLLINSNNVIYDYDSSINKVVHTGCFRHVSGHIGRCFLWTTHSCMSSKVGRWPTSSSNGRRYSPMGPWGKNYIMLLIVSKHY